MRWRLFLGIWLVGLTVWAQVPPVSSGEPAVPIASQPDRRPAVDSSATNQPQPRIPMPKRPRATLPMFVFFGAALGAMLFMSLFTIAQSLLNRDAPYGWYAAYLTATAIWFWQAISSWFDVLPRLSGPDFSLSIMLVLGYSMMVSYVRFISSLLKCLSNTRI